MVWVLAVGFLGGTLVRAEFTVGSTLPKISLPSTDGAQIDLIVANGAVSLTQSSGDTRPAAVVVYLLQPDCLQCRAQLKELQALDDRFPARGVAVVGISHRGDMTELQQLGKDLGLKIPLLHGPDSETAKQFAAGPCCSIFQPNKSL